MDPELLEYVREVGEQFLLELDDAAEQSANFGHTGKALPLVTAAMDRALASLAATALVGPAIELPSKKLWQVAGEALSRGELQTRAHEKPRGYAGDDVLLLKIWRRDICQDALGRCFDEYFQRQDAPQAVRARFKEASRLMLEHAQAASGTYKAASIGSGPALEMVEALGDWPHPSAPEIVLLDLDPQALADAEQRVQQVRDDARLTAVRENLYRLPKQAARANPLAECSLLVSLGFFDYLDDEAAAGMLQLMWTSLAPGGRLVVGNFAPTCSTRPYMEWVGNWYLRYRSPENLARLAGMAGIDQQYFRIDKPWADVQLLLVADKP